MYNNDLVKYEIIDYEHVNTKILNCLQNFDNDDLRMLDVGCWKGALGSVILKYKNWTIDGIDVDMSALEHAKNRGYSELSIIDLNNDFDKPENTYDIIVYGDVLEHTIKPGKVLFVINKSLKKHGTVIISLPNIGFIYYRILHLLGYWDYKDMGVMDRTHLRFYVVKTMKKLVKESGLELLNIHPYVGMHHMPFIIKKSIRALSVLWPSLFANQIVLVARKP